MYKQYDFFKLWLNHKYTINSKILEKLSDLYNKMYTMPECHTMFVHVNNFCLNYF